MANTRLLFLSEQEEDLIHSQSLRLLDEMGVLVRSKSVLQLLEGKGAIVDYDAMTARMPAEMIDSALDTAPREMTLCGRDPRNDVRLPATDYPYTVNNGLAIFVVDKDTGEYRDCNSDDLAEFMKFSDALDGLDFVWPALSAKDKPAHAQTLYELWITMQNTSKHVQGDVVDGAHNARAQIELAALVVGGEDKLRERPIFSMTCCRGSGRAGEGGHSHFVHVHVAFRSLRTRYHGRHTDQRQCREPGKSRDYPVGLAWRAAYLRVGLDPHGYGHRQHRLRCARVRPDQHWLGSNGQEIPTALIGIRLWSNRHRIGRG